MRANLVWKVLGGAGVLGAGVLGAMSLAAQSPVPGASEVLLLDRDGNVWHASGGSLRRCWIDQYDASTACDGWQ